MRAFWTCSRHCSKLRVRTARAPATSRAAMRSRISWCCSQVTHRRSGVVMSVMRTKRSRWLMVPHIEQGPVAGALGQVLMEVLVGHGGVDVHVRPPGQQGLPLAVEPVRLSRGQTGVSHALDEEGLERQAHVAKLFNFTAVGLLDVIAGVGPLSTRPFSTSMRTASRMGLRLTANSSHSSCSVKRLPGAKSQRITRPLMTAKISELRLERTDAGSKVWLRWPTATNKPARLVRVGCV